MTDNNEQSIPSRGSVAKCKTCGGDCVEGYDAEGVLVRVPARSRWIPVTERLPEECVNVLALAIEDWQTGADAWQDVSSMFNGRWLIGSATVTHWMPLPAPPTDSK